MPTHLADKKTDIQWDWLPSLRYTVGEQQGWGLNPRSIWSQDPWFIHYIILSPHYNELLEIFRIWIQIRWCYGMKQIQTVRTWLLQSLYIHWNFHLQSQSPWVMRKANWPCEWISWQCTGEVRQYIGFVLSQLAWALALPPLLVSYVTPLNLFQLIPFSVRKENILVGCMIQNVQYT